MRFRVLNSLKKWSPKFRRIIILGTAISVSTTTAFAKTNTGVTAEEPRIHTDVKKYYGETLETNKDLKTNACCASSPPHPVIAKALQEVPKEILEKFYGCGNPIPLGIEGLTILDLGSGSGRDCYVASQLVGESGKVIGIDMTDEQLEVARRHVKSFTRKIGYKKPNMEFLKGYIEKIGEAGVKPNSVDLVISNCVVNLSPRKDLIFEEVYKCLKEGGEFYFSDVYCDRRLSEEVRKNEILWGECLSGALYVEDFKRLCHQVGFTDPRMLEVSEIKVLDPKIKELLGNAKFYSITYRLFKLPSLETLCEDYGQYAVYNGTLSGHTHGYALDDHHFFETDKPMLVCGNSGSMVGETWLSPHFTVVGSRDTHFGLFDCSPVKVSSSSTDSGSSGCC